MENIRFNYKEDSQDTGVTKSFRFYVNTEDLIANYLSTICEKFRLPYKISDLDLFISANEKQWKLSPSTESISQILKKFNFDSKGNFEFLIIPKLSARINFFLESSINIQFNQLRQKISSLYRFFKYEETCKMFCEMGGIDHLLNATNNLQPHMYNNILKVFGIFLEYGQVRYIVENTRCLEFFYQCLESGLNALILQSISIQMTILQIESGKYADKLCRASINHSISTKTKPWTVFVNILKSTEVKIIQQSLNYINRLLLLFPSQEFIDQLNNVKYVENLKTVSNKFSNSTDLMYLVDECENLVLCTQTRFGKNKTETSIKGKNVETIKKSNQQQPAVEKQIGGKIDQTSKEKQNLAQFSTKDREKQEPRNVDLPIRSKQEPSKIESIRKERQNIGKVETMKREKQEPSKVNIIEKETKKTDFIGREKQETGKLYSGDRAKQEPKRIETFAKQERSQGNVIERNKQENAKLDSTGDNTETNKFVEKPVKKNIPIFFMRQPKNKETVNKNLINKPEIIEPIPEIETKEEDSDPRPADKQKSKKYYQFPFKHGSQPNIYKESKIEKDSMDENKTSQLKLEVPEISRIKSNPDIVEEERYEKAQTIQKPSSKIADKWLKRIQDKEREENKLKDRTQKKVVSEFQVSQQKDSVSEPNSSFGKKPELKKSIVRSDKISRLLSELERSDKFAEIKSKEKEKEFKEQKTTPSESNFQNKKLTDLRNKEESVESLNFRDDQSNTKKLFKNEISKARDKYFEIGKEKYRGGKFNNKISDLDFSDLDTEKKMTRSASTPCINKDKNFGNAPPPPPPPLIMNKRKTLSEIVKQTREEGDKTKVYWSAVDTKTGGRQDSVWNLIKEDSLEINDEEMAELFKTAPTFTTNEPVRREKVTHVLPYKRILQLNVVLFNFPKVEVIKRAILKMDDQEIKNEHVEILHNVLLPSMDEEKILKEVVDHPMDQSERYLLSLLEIDMLRERVELWSFLTFYSIEEKEIALALHSLKNATNEIKASKTFRFILSATLKVGNILNSQQVEGFQLDFLSELGTIKDKVHKQPLLLHVCNAVTKQYKGSTNLVDEIPSIALVLKEDWNEIMRKIKKLISRCQDCQRHYEKLTKSSNPPEYMVKLGLVSCLEKLNELETIHGKVMERFSDCMIFLGVPPSKAELVQHYVELLYKFSLEYKSVFEKVTKA